MQTLNIQSESRFFSELTFGNDDVVALELVQEGDNLGSLQRHQHETRDHLARGTTERARDGSRIHEPLAIFSSNMRPAVNNGKGGGELTQESHCWRSESVRKLTCGCAQ